MTLGSLNTKRTWTELLGDLRVELDKWNITDYVLPTYKVSKATGVVELSFARRGLWTPIRCGVFGSDYKGPERNLCAIKEAVRAIRLADQRGIADIFVQAAKALALPDPNDPYTILGVSREANADVARSAYLEGLKKNHPDHGGNVDAFQRVRAAGEKLGVA